MLKYLPQLINLCATMILMLSFAMISQRRIVSLINLFAMQGYGVAADITTMAKGLAGGLPLALYGLRSGLICAGVCLFGILRACLRRRSSAPFRLAARELDCDTLLLLFGLFILIEGIRKAGVIDAAAQLFYTLSGDDSFRL